MSESVYYFAERGVTLCASQVGMSLDFTRRLLERMHELELNTLVWEMKVKSSRWEHSNNWHYYTVEEVEGILALAQSYGIEVIPEVNAPGHMGIWLENNPEYALKRQDGTIDPAGRLDITNPEAIRFYLEIVEEYLKLFPGTWWHMGADEYMEGDSFHNYPQILAYARETLGPEACEYDLFNSFVNQVNAFVKSRGRVLRTWNDGLHETKVVPVDADIVVEYWKDAGLRARDLIERGHILVNVSEDLYWSRSYPTYQVDAAELWSSDWDANTFIGGQILPDKYTQQGKHRGLRLSIWPDFSFRETEKEVWDTIQDSLILVSEIGKYGEKRQRDWDTVKAAAPPFTPWNDDLIPAGIYEIPQLDVVAQGPWLVSPTPDSYRVLTDQDSGKNLALITGQEHLGVVTQAGAQPELCDPADMSPLWPDGKEGSKARNTQKWLVTPAGNSEETGKPEGKTIELKAHIAPALTGQVLTHGAGVVAQYPPDMVVESATEFTFRIM